MDVDKNRWWIKMEVDTEDSNPYKLIKIK